MFATIYCEGKALQISPVFYISIIHGKYFLEELMIKTVPIWKILFGLFEEGDTVVSYEICQVIFVVVVTVFNLLTCNVWNI